MGRTAVAASRLSFRRLIRSRVAMTGTMATKNFWDKPNPKKKSKPLSPAQKAAAKRRAAAAGRPYPNLVDNAAVKRRKR